MLISKNKLDMKTKYNLIVLLCLFGLFSSCNDYLDHERPLLTNFSEAWETADDAVMNATSCYVPLMWEWGSGFAPEWVFGDICSDDAFTGGDSDGAMGEWMELENFKTLSNNNTILRFYQWQYQGIMRCNLLLEQVPLMDPEAFVEDPALQDRVIAEALFLRAMYYMRLVRIYGGVPLVTEVLKEQAGWRLPRASEAEIYAQIYTDLEAAIKNLPEKDGYAPKDLGRATKGAAKALLMRAYMNNAHRHNDMELFSKTEKLGKEIINSGQYFLVSNYYDVFTVAGENGGESVFETQYVQEGTSDVWGGVGFSRGTLTVGMTRPPWSGGDAWGYNKPTKELYDTYEPGDYRRDVTIYEATLEQVPANGGAALGVHFGNRYSSLKYALMNPDSTWSTFGHISRAPINRKEIRYPDVLLMYAEACVETNNLTEAKWALEQVRARARANSADPATMLKPFPYGSYSDNANDLKQAIRHERRLELAMEGHRWFDLKRWNILAETMNEYRRTTHQEAVLMQEFVKGKHELFPIPQIERDLNPMPQNPGYDGEPIR